MPGALKRMGLAGVLALLVGTWVLRSSAQSAGPLPVPGAEEITLTNLTQLTGALRTNERLNCHLQLEGVVCAASKPERGMVVLQDSTGVELLELGRHVERLSPGERIRLEGASVLLRRRELGTQICPAPTVDNDGLHPWKLVTGQVVLQAGRVPLELDWFNCLSSFVLDVSCQGPDGSGRVPASSLWHVAAGAPVESTNRLPGLQAECYEGFWQKVPDFDLLHPVRTGATTNLDFSFRSRDELVGLRLSGFFDVPRDGTYSFSVAADDGALLFVGSPQLAIRRLGTAPVPLAATGWIGQPMDRLEERRWLAVEGRVSFISRTGEGVELELRSGVDTLAVRVADAAGLESAGLLNAYVRAVGVGRATLSASQRVVLDRLCVADARAVQPVALAAEARKAALPLVPISHVQSMQAKEAKRELPVRVRGVITAANRGDRWLSLQDDTRGIFVDLHSLSNAAPETAELSEVIGHTAPGNFAPIIVAEQIQRLGEGHLPEPARPSWSELANGSMDVQWVEIQGLVSGVQSNQLSLLLPEGTLAVSMDHYFASELSAYQNAVVRIRGTLFAIWNAETREVQFGSVGMRNAKVMLETPPPADPFDAPTKSARDLLRFDAQATAFRPVKVRAQTVYADGQEIFAMDEGAGLRVVATEEVGLQPGDWFEAVGYPVISGPSPLLRQALIRKTGSTSLPAARLLAGADLMRKGLDATLVRVEGKLIGIHLERHSPVLEMQSNGQLFVARFKAGAPAALSLREGSQLELSGVYAQTGRSQRLASQVEAFELLLNSLADIRVLSQPSWWTLGRLGAVVGFLLVVLLLAAVWIKQLRRQVEQRTAQLRREIRERERAERQRAIETERSRIARDLHDDLGSSLTEIGVLASTGQRHPAEGEAPTLFQAIAAKARGLIAALDVIVWAVDPEDNSLQSLADYLSGFVDDFLAHSGLPCRFKVPVTFPPVMLDGQVRHGLLLAVKEALNNVVRHAEATQVEFHLAAVDSTLAVVIIDNGKGFDATQGGEGHGLKNLPTRLAQLGGSCLVESVPGQGTTVRMRLPLAVSAPACASGAGR